jgi:hypothetical protein
LASKPGGEDVFGLFAGENKRTADMIAADRIGYSAKVKRLIIDGNSAEPRSFQGE